jgi:hypothetical protein
MHIYIMHIYIYYVYHLMRHIHGESELTIETWQINDGHNHSWLTYKPTAVNHGN